MTEFDRRALRDAFGTFMTGVTVTTTRDAAGSPRGFTANSFTSVSLDPPLLLVCVAKAAPSCEVFQNATGFAVNVLEEQQAEVSSLFATPRPDRFEQVEWRDSASGFPILDGVAAWFDCQLHQVVDAGDHVMLVGRVVDFASTGANGLGFSRGSYFVPGLEQQAVTAAAAGSLVVVGAVVEKDGALLLVPDDSAGDLRPPAVGLDGQPGSVARLTAHLDELGVQARVGPLYAVYESGSTGGQGIYYRAVARAEPTGPGRFFPIDEIPWEQVTSAPMRTMLERYVDEHRRGQFGIYYGSDDSGTVHPVDD